MSGSSSLNFVIGLYREHLFVTLSAPALEATDNPVMVLMVKLFPAPVEPMHKTQL